MVRANAKLRKTIFARNRALEKSERRLTELTESRVFPWPVPWVMKLLADISTLERSRGWRATVALLVVVSSFAAIQFFHAAFDLHVETVTFLVVSGFVTLFSGLWFGMATSLVLYVGTFSLRASFGNGAADPSPPELAALVMVNLVVGAAIFLFKEAYRQAVVASEDARSANRAKSRFLAGISHELRTPLGAILGFSELITDPASSESERKSYAEAVHRNGEILKAIIDDILDLSKVEAEKISIHVEEVSLQEVLRDVEQVMKPRGEEKNLSLRFHLASDLPTVIKTDSIRLRQILTNLIGNALKFTADGSVSVTVHWQDPKAHTLLAFDVTDTGKGVESSQVPNLFQIFSQAHSEGRKLYGGTGIGLALSRGLARLLGGDLVLAQTAIGHGSTFTLTIDPALSKSETPS